MGLGTRSKKSADPSHSPQRSPVRSCMCASEGGWKRGKEWMGVVAMAARFFDVKEMKNIKIYFASMHGCDEVAACLCLETIKKRARGGYICNSNPLLFSEAVFILARACMCLGIFYRRFSTTTTQAASGKLFPSALRFFYYCVPGPLCYVFIG